MGGQRKSGGGRVTPKGGTSRDRLTADEKAGLEAIFSRILTSAHDDLSDGLDPLGTELWASQMWSIWQRAELIGMDATAVFAGGLIDYATKRPSPGALAVLRALAAVAPEPYGSRARRGAEALSKSGLNEPAWAAELDVVNPTEAWLSFDPVDDDGVAVMVSFFRPGGEHTLGVYIDHNLGAMAKDAFVVPAGVDEVIQHLGQREDENPAEYRQISLPEAAARWRDAFERTDLTVEPPTTDDIDGLRALVFSRLTHMPAGSSTPIAPEPDDAERTQLLSEFLQSEETVGLFGEGNESAEVVEHLSMSVMTFSFDYVGGTPLRFSPVMAEIFCLDWAPRKIAVDGKAFMILPDVLAAWIRFAGRRRGIPEEAIRESVEAAYDYAPEMIDVASDPASWGPAKTIALAIEERGLDVSDKTALDNFMNEINSKGGIDWLTESAHPF